MSNDAAFILGFLIAIVVIGSFFGGICAAIASAKGRSAVGWFFGGFFLGLMHFTIGIVMVIVVSCLPNLKEKRSREEAQERENRRLREQLVQEQIKNEAFRQHAAARLDQHDVHIGVDTRQTVPMLGMGMAQFAPPPQLLGHDPLQPPAAPAWPGPVSTGAVSTGAVPTAVPMPGVQVLPPAAGSNGTMNVAMNGNGMMPHPAAQGFPAQGFPAQGFSGQGFSAQGVPATNDYAVVPPPLPAEEAPKPAVTVGREWHYEYRGETRGPITDRQLVTLAKSGEITTDTLVWTEQLGDWKPAGQIKPLQPHLRTA